MAKKDLNGINDLTALTPEDIDSIGENYGQKLAHKYDGIKTNQVRNIFSAITALRTNLRNNGKWTDDIHRDLVMLKPKLAYAAGRQKNVKTLYSLLSQAITATVNSQDKIKALEKFILLVETIVAYHKFYGGKDK